MELEMKQEGHGPKHDKHHHHGPSYWASWCSPIGLGIFFLTTALAAAIALYAILNIVGVVMSFSHSEPSYSAQEMPQQQDMTVPATSGADMPQQ